MPGCSSPPVTSASNSNRARYLGSAANWGWISLRATSRFSSTSRARKTSPSPPLACGRRMRNRVPAEVESPTLAKLAVGSGSAPPRRGDVHEAGLDIGVRDAGEVVAHRADRAERRQALLGVVAVQPQVLGHQGLQQQVPAGRERAALQEDPAQAARAVGNPAVEAIDQGIAVDEVVLQRQQAQEQVPPGVLVGRAGPPPAPTWSQRGLGEGGLDHGRLAGEPVAILGGCGFLALAPAQLDLQRDQLAQQRGTLRLVDRDQEFLDPRALAGPPGGLEAVAGGIYPLGGRIRAALVLGRWHFWCHESISGRMGRIVPPGLTPILTRAGARILKEPPSPIRLNES